MSALKALEAARSAGIKLSIEGRNLALSAASPPPAAVLDALSLYKVEIVALLQPVELWRSAFSRLDPLEPPCPGFRPRWWLATCRDVAQFLDGDFARLAVEFGWSTVQLFGVHRDVGAIRFDCTGALLVNLRGQRITQCTSSLIRFQNGSAYYRRDMSAASIPIWDFKQKETDQ